MCFGRRGWRRVFADWRSEVSYGSSEMVREHCGSDPGTPRGGCLLAGSGHVWEVTRISGMVASVESAAGFEWKLSATSFLPTRLTAVRIRKLHLVRNRA